jgi:hypothetical protein
MSDSASAHVKHEDGQAPPPTQDKEKKDFSTAILQRKKAPNRLLVDDSVSSLWRVVLFANWPVCLCLNDAFHACSNRCFRFRF